MEKRSSGTRTWLIVVAFLIVAGIVAYFVGMAVDRSAREREAGVAEQRDAALQGQLQSARGQLASSQSENNLLTANVWAYRATIALDARNFGVANNAVAQVVSSLNKVDSSAADLDPKALAALKSQAGRVKISVATNLEGQRAQLLQLAAGITTLSGQSMAKLHSEH
jgi:hypothetical protein